MPEVLQYVDFKDIPAGGTNNWKRFGTPEPVFAFARSEYAGQAVGLIVAESRLAAIEALISTNTSADTEAASTGTRAEALLSQV